MLKRIRSVLRWAIPLVLMPLFVVLGGGLMGERFYAWGILGMVLLTQGLFFVSFEKRNTGARRLAVAAVMTALSVLGRIVLAPIPGFKPITALVVLTAIWIGGETGFLVGALSALISNFFSGQGPWTPFQMFAWGMLGLLAGVLAEPLKRNRLLLAAVLWYNGGINWPMYQAAVLTALPYTLSYAASNVVFLMVLGKPIGEKLHRVKIKYGV